MGFEVLKKLQFPSLSFRSCCSSPAPPPPALFSKLRSFFFYMKLVQVVVNRPFSSSESTIP